LHWLQDPSEINGDSLNNVRHKASRHFRNEKKEYPKDKINESNNVKFLGMIVDSTISWKKKNTLNLLKAN
jgi:hypothetical protein